MVSSRLICFAALRQRHLAVEMYVVARGFFGLDEELAGRAVPRACVELFTHLRIDGNVFEPSQMPVLTLT